MNDERGEAERRRRIARIRKIELAILVPLLIGAYAAFQAFGTVQVVGNSMSPTLKNGQRLLILKAYRRLSPIQVGDVVTIYGRSQNVAGAEVIKRVVFIQNARGDRPWPERIATPVGEYRRTDLFPDGAPDCPTNVPNGIYLLGDNITGSEDSRDFGPVQAQDVSGKVVRQ